MNRKILALAVPNIISNISVPLLGIVDMSLMGHLDSDAYIGAVALGSMIFNFIYWSLGFLRMGTSGFTAQAWGSGDVRETVAVFTRASLVAFILIAALLILQKPLELLSFWALNGEKDVELLASSYFRIRIWAAPATIGQYALLGFFLGMQNAKLPMIVLVSSNAINIICNYIFVMVLHMDSDGVALGTVIAQYSGFFIACLFLWKYFRRLFKYIHLEASLQWNRLKDFLQVNKNIFIRTMCLVVVFTFFTARSASTDKADGGEDTILAVNSLLMQFFMFFSFLIDGFAHASEALTGRFIGAKKAGSLLRFIGIVFLWGAAISILFTFVYLLGGEYIFRILTDNPEVIANAKPYFFWVVLIPVLSFAAFLWDGIFIGATAGKEMRNAMLVSTLIIFFPLYYISEHFFENHGLWLAFILFMTSRGVVMSLLARKAVLSKMQI